jgi:hypothetical protein
MNGVLVPVSNHLFSPEALQAALDKAIPQADLGPGQHGAATAAIDSDGVKVALLFTSKDDHWRIRGAYEHDWSGDNRGAGDILYKF